ncbi:MAG: hypothetical protein JWL61_3171 [Gemmatimonadetes bacterium]|nr:hypothetical protein [Gemmatimonadota bacterium]
MTARPHVVALFALLAFVPVTSAHAQIRASEIGTMSQIIDGTKLSMEYSRPRSRGRDTLFGTPAVHWDEVWTPGANNATSLDVSKDIKLNGHTVPKGAYSVWFVVKEKGDWTAVLDPKVKRYHMNPPDSSAAQIRFAIKPEAAPFTEVLSFSMPALRANGGTLLFQWERVRIPIDVEVQPSLVMTMSAAEAAPYLGKYDYVEMSTGKATKRSVFTVTHEDGTLKGEFAPADPYFRKFALIRIGPDWFAPGVYDRKGQIYEVYRPEITYEFTRKDGRAVSLKLREEDDTISATGTRVP